MKQALIVDQDGEVGDFAASALDTNEYELTVVPSLQDALALLSGAHFHLVLIAELTICPDVVWRMVESIKRLSSDAAMILVQAENADAGFHARARKLGAIVLSTPLDVTARTTLREATPG
jgi:DNA-binding response OmpR family regulator